ncbi:MAG: hypothetical protein J7K51_10680 [Thermotogae bacterium]|nr:hypothetical protein [Thermotogota bacterium]
MPVRIAYVLKEDELCDAVRIFVMGLEEYLLYIRSIADNIPIGNPPLIS